MTKSPLKFGYKGSAKIDRVFIPAHYFLSPPSPKPSDVWGSLVRVPRRVRGLDAERLELYLLHIIYRLCERGGGVGAVGGCVRRASCDWCGGLVCGDGVWVWLAHGARCGESPRRMHESVRPESSSALS